MLSSSYTFAGIIFTGQERPTGVKQSLREDLLKKFLTGEGISARLPYAIVTKLIEVSGWKRVELNKMFRFFEITEDNVESIVRRFAVIKIAAKFYEKAFLTSVLPNHEEFGIFARESDAKAFLMSTLGPQS